ncbi:MAG: glycosyltransferase family 1 protein [Elusimicrobia bacterium]|nr:glycosyltransferase family 1 protein [Elusimicrobiota bacterium]
MRIGLDISSALAGNSGLDMYVKNLVKGLAAVDQENEYFLYSAFWSRPDRMAAFDLPLAGNFRPAFKRFPQRLLLPADEFGLGLQERWLRDWKLDLFHGLGNTIPRLHSLPSVVTVHHVGGLSPQATAWDRFYFDFLTTRSVRRAHAVVAVSEFTRGEILRRWSLDPTRVATVLEGGPAPEFRPREGRRPPTRARPFILHVGSFLEHKNIPTLVKAYHGLLARAPECVGDLVLAGHGGRDLARVESLIRELGLGGRVDILTGASRGEIVSLYQDAAAVVVPSLIEGFGFAALEAMACGAPILVSRAGALPELVGDAGLVFDPLDCKALTLGLQRILTDASLAADLRRRGLERVRRFSWDKTARDTIEVYRRTLGQGR